MACVWQFVASRREQWRSASDHVSPLAGTLAVAAKVIVSPTAQVVVVVGAVIETVGGAPTVIVSVAGPVRPAVSVTRRRTVTVPVVEYVRDGLATVESSWSPSPSRSQAYVSAWFSGSL